MNTRILDTSLESIEIHLNSEDSLYNFHKSHYHFKLKHDIHCPAQYIMRICVKNATIPNSFYNVNNTNNTLIFKYDNSDYTFIADVGNYNIQQFLTALHNFFVSSIGDVVTIRWMHQQNKVELSPQKQLQFLKESTMLKLLGFSKENHSSGSVGNSLISDGLIDIRLNDCFYIQSDITTNTKSFAKTNRHHQTIAKVPVTSETFGVNVFEPLNPNQVLLPNNSFTSMNIKITNHNGDELDFNNQLWSMTLEINFYKKPVTTYTQFNKETGTYQTTSDADLDIHLSELALDRQNMTDALINQDYFNIIFV